MAAVVEVEVGGGAAVERELDEVRGVERQGKKRQPESEGRGSETLEEEGPRGDGKGSEREKGAE